MYQLPPRKMTRAAVDKLPFRDDDEDGEHIDGKAYRTRHGYPNDVFVWVAYPEGSETKGEWQRGPVEIS